MFEEPSSSLPDSLLALTHRLGRETKLETRWSLNDTLSESIQKTYSTTGAALTDN